MVNGKSGWLEISAEMVELIKAVGQIFNVYIFASADPMSLDAVSCIGVVVRETYAASSWKVVYTPWVLSAVPLQVGGKVQQLLKGADVVRRPCPRDTSSCSRASADNAERMHVVTDPCGNSFEPGADCEEPRGAHPGSE
jgi:hypothetical protein